MEIINNSFLEDILTLKSIYKWMYIFILSNLTYVSVNHKNCLSGTQV